MMVTGKVEIEVTIAPEGSVEDAKPISGNPLLTAPTISTLKKWKFNPVKEKRRAYHSRHRPNLQFLAAIGTRRRSGEACMRRTPIGTKLMVSFGGMALAIAVLAAVEAGSLKQRFSRIRNWVIRSCGAPARTNPSARILYVFPVISDIQPGYFCASLTVLSRNKADAGWQCTDG